MVTTRLYEGNSAIRYQDVSLTLASTPSRGDKFYVEKTLTVSVTMKTFCR